METLFANWHHLSFGDGGWGWNLLRGLSSTLQIALGAYFLGLVIGLLGAVGKRDGSRLTRYLLEIYTTLIRAIPELVLILLLYYAGTGLVNQLMESMGYRPIDISGLVAGIVVLGIVQGAYSIEVIRGAMRVVPRGQLEAAEAFGMGRWMILRRITLPAMLPHALPGLSNLWLIVTKETALLSVVGFSELALTTRQAAGASRAYFMFFLVAACLYLCVSLLSNELFRRLEKRARRGQPELN
ncbi:ABC transporter permease [Granulosicoccus antarcticus]|uniref:Histidine transport system permease protein HisQ n=1 Tax=Granulosicoccus antarcticus IMCC3135 TaxID=1192854 RepID=A0A2Z2NUN8_9GAMM|nr:ABC transporter permease [Granulosicoccus antarcticus]ASJ72480.1 Histidine transport system permease protein HisQ [Granulosicoccus antarcticus IMCC3135]